MYRSIRLRSTLVGIRQLTAAADVFAVGIKQIRFARRLANRANVVELGRVVIHVPVQDAEVDRMVVLAIHLNLGVAGRQEHVAVPVLGRIAVVAGAAGRPARRRL